MSYILPILFFAGVSAVAGTILTISDKIFKVEVDDTVERIIESLPGMNCGACGFASCAKYAASVANNSVAANQCKPGGEEAVNKIANVLGKKIDVAEREVAFVHCSGSCKSKYDYNGTDSCLASELYFNGKEQCRYGCAGLGDCIDVCPEGAISIINHRAVVNPNKCSGCGICSKACPKNIITVQKITRDVHIECFSKDKGKLTRAVCQKGCIGCKICEKKCPNKAIIIKDNLAHINYDLCTACKECISVCPTKCITIVDKCPDNKTNI